MGKLPGRVDTRVVFGLTDNTCMDTFLGWGKPRTLRCAVQGCGTTWNSSAGGGYGIEWPAGSREPTSPPFPVCPAHVEQILNRLP